MALPAKGPEDVPFISVANQRSPTSARAASYGSLRRLCQIAWAALSLVLYFADTPAAHAQTQIRIVALGDSLTAGLGLPANEAFVPRLRATLAAEGTPAEILNAGVSGDTASGGLARLDWSVPNGTEAVIVELGANDMLRGVRPQVTRDALDALLHRLRERHVAVLLCGTRAAPNLGADYVKSFEAIYPELAVKYEALLYPFFLDGVAGRLDLLQPDGLHPNAAGVEVIVRRILPKVEEMIARARARPPP